VTALELVYNKPLDPVGYYTKPCDESQLSDNPTDLMDPNSFDLVELEIALVKANTGDIYSERYPSEKADWFRQDETRFGVVLNHSNVLYRRAYDDEAREQLLRLAVLDGRIHRVLQQRPRWGLDISLEYISHQGDMFEILHWEYDSDNYNEIEELRQRYEPVILNTDWEDGARHLLKRKTEWHHLHMKEQNKYKTDYFGFVEENYGRFLWT